MSSLEKTNYVDTTIEDEVASLLEADPPIPMHDLTEELVALRTRVRGLAQRIEDQEETIRAQFVCPLSLTTQYSGIQVIGDLQEQLRRVKKAEIPSVMANSRAGTPVQLHSIAVRSVFDVLFSPARFLVPFRRPGPLSPWFSALQARKAIALVCKVWHDEALPFLYEDISVFHAGQLSALARTIRSSPQYFGPLIKHLRIACFIPQGFETVAREDLSFLLQSCSSLRGISFWDFHPPDQLQALHPVWTIIPPNILHLETISLNRALQAVSEPVMPPFFHTFVNLVSLSIDPWQFNWKQDPLMCPMSLPLLQTLSIRGLDIPEAIHLWNLPRLQWVELVPQPRRDLPALRASLRFFQWHGKKLARLIVSLDYLTWAECQMIADFLKHCPILEHLVVMSNPLSQDLYHERIFLNTLHRGHRTPSSIHLDLCVPLDNFQQDDDEERRSRWKNVRLIDASLVDILPGLPHLLPPDEVLSNSLRIHDMFGLIIAQTDNYVVKRSDRYDDYLEQYRHLADRTYHRFQ